MPNFTRFLSLYVYLLAVSAEKIYLIDPAACVLNCRRAMEFAVKWMYSVDGGLVMPYDDRLVSLMDAEDFRDIVGEDLWRRPEVHPADGKRRRPHGEEDHGGTGSAVPGEPLHLPGLYRLLLREGLHRGAV